MPGISTTGGLMLIGMLSKLMPPVLTDLYEINSPIAHERFELELKKLREKNQIERENQSIMRKEKLEEDYNRMREEFSYKLKLAEDNLNKTQNNWRYQKFFQDCFPLRNPCDLPMGVIEGQDQRLKLSTLTTQNGEPYVPLRIIFAYTPNLAASQCEYDTVTNKLSNFIAEIFPKNSGYGVQSDVGSWKKEFDVNDANLNYLFKALIGQPVLVINPSRIDNGQTLSVKMWSWNMDDENIPSSVECASIDIDYVYRRAALQHAEQLYDINNRTNEPISNTLQQVHANIINLEQCSANLSPIEYKEKLRSIILPQDVKNSALIDTYDYIAQLLSSIVGMYSDAYNMLNYGIKPVMQQSLSQLNKISEFVPTIETFYDTLMTQSCKKGLISHVEAGAYYYQLYSSIRNLDSCSLNAANNILIKLHKDSDSKEDFTALNEIRKTLEI